MHIIVTENQYFDLSTFMSTFSKLMISSIKIYFFVEYSSHLKSNKRAIAYTIHAMDCTSLYQSMFWQSTPQTLLVTSNALYAISHYITVLKDKLCICNVKMLFFTMTER